MYSMYLYRYKENEKRFLNSSYRFKKKMKDNGGGENVCVCVCECRCRERINSNHCRKEGEEGRRGGREDGWEREGKREEIVLFHASHSSINPSQKVCSQNYRCSKTISAGKKILSTWKLISLYFEQKEIIKRKFATWDIEWNIIKFSLPGTLCPCHKVASI